MYLLLLLFLLRLLPASSFLQWRVQSARQQKFAQSCHTSEEMTQKRRPVTHHPSQPITVARTRHWTRRPEPTPGRGQLKYCDIIHLTNKAHKEPRGVCRRPGPATEDRQRNLPPSLPSYRAPTRSRAASGTERKL